MFIFPEQLSDGGGGAEPLTPRQALTAAMLQELEAEKAAAAGAGGIASPVPLAGAASSGGVPPQLTARNPMHANVSSGVWDKAGSAHNGIAAMQSQLFT